MLRIDDSDKFYGKGGNGLSGASRKDKADRATVEQVGEQGLVERALVRGTVVQEYSSGAPVKAITGRRLAISCKIECELFEADWAESVLVYAIEISRQCFSSSASTISVATDVAMPFYSSFCTVVLASRGSNYT